LGVGGYYLIPSLGPFAFAPEEFAGLPHTITQDTQARYLAQRAHLLADPQASDATAQIAAFASLHVAIMMMILLMTRYYGLRRATQAMAVYVAGTMLATIYLGWHFSVDLVGGVVIAYAAAFLGRWLIDPQRTLVHEDQVLGPLAN
jgi:membrane-associated phospholipid phosphatase